MSKTITEEEIKAFIDDLAFIQHKHGLCVRWSGDGVCIEHADQDDGTTVGADLEGCGWLLRVGGSYEFFLGGVSYGRIKVEVQSEDFENMSAHNLMLWKRKQREAALDGQSVSGNHNGTLNKRVLDAMRRVHPKNDGEQGR